MELSNLSHVEYMALVIDNTSKSFILPSRKLLDDTRNFLKTERVLQPLIFICPEMITLFVSDENPGFENKLLDTLRNFCCAGIISSGIPLIFN